MNNKENRGSRIGVVMVLSNIQIPLGGTQKQALCLADELQSQGVSVCVVSRRQRIFKITRGGYGKGSPVQETNGRLKFIYLPIHRLQPAWSFLFSFLIWAGINRKHFQIIHAHNTRLGVIASVVGWLIRKKVVIKIPSVEHLGVIKGGSLFRELRRWILTKGVASFIAVSKELAKALQDAGISPQKIALIPNGIEAPTRTGYSNRSALKVEILGSSEVQVVLYVGRLIEEKGLDQLFTVWASMPSRDGVVLLIVGDGPSRKDLESRVGELQILPSVRFLGHQADVSKFYAIADLFVLPSRTEGMSNALLEAMAMGVPVVVSDTGGNKDVLEDQSGVLVDWGNTAACVQVLSTLLSDSNHRNRLGGCARRRALHFNLGDVAKEYRRLYQSVLQG